MKKVLKIGFIAVGSLVAFVAAVVCIACWLIFTPARLTSIVNKVADKYLDCEMSVGEIDLTIFSTFPEVSLQLSDVVLINPIDSAANDTVAAMQHCRAVLDAGALLNEQVVILRGLHLNGGWVNLYTNAEGKANYMVFPVDTVTVEEVDTVAFEIPDVDIKEIDMRDIRVSYYDATVGQKAVIEGLALQVNGRMLGEQLQAALNASLQKISVDIEGESAMNASVENVMLGVEGKLQGDDMECELKLKAGVVDALVPDMNAHVEQVEWTFNGCAKEGKWTGNIALTTQPVVADMEGDMAMSAVLSSVQFKADAQWQGNDVAVNPSLLLPELTVTLDGEQMLDKADIQLRAALHTDTLLSHVALTQGLLTLNEHEINLKGGVEMPDTSTINADINFETNHSDITRLLALVPQSYRYLFDGIAVSGGVALKGEGHGSLVDGQAHIGKVGAVLSLDNIDLQYNDSIELQSHRANINMVYNGKRDHATGYLVSDMLHVAMVGMADAQLRDVKGSFSVLQAMRVADGYVDAQVHFSMEELAGEMDTLGLFTRDAAMDITLNADKNKELHFDAALLLDSMHTAMGSLVTASTGKLSVKVHAAYDETGENILSQWDPQLAVEVQAGDVASSMITVPVAIPHIQFDYADGRFTINDSRILLGNSDFGLRGDVHSIDSFINKTGLLKAELDFWSAFTDVTQLMDLVSGLGVTEETMEEEVAEEVVTSEDDPFMVPLGVDVKLNTDIRTVNVNGFKFDDIGGHVTVKDGVLVLEEMGFTSDATDSNVQIST